MEQHILEMVRLGLITVSFGTSGGCFLFENSQDQNQTTCVSSLQDATPKPGGCKIPFFLEGEPHKFEWQFVSFQQHMKQKDIVKMLKIFAKIIGV